MDEYKGPIINFNGKTFKCEFDADEGVLAIEGNDIKCLKRGLKGMELFPFANCYS